MEKFFYVFQIFHVHNIHKLYGLLSFTTFVSLCFNTIYDQHLISFLMLTRINVYEHLYVYLFYMSRNNLFLT